MIRDIKTMALVEDDINKLNKYRAEKKAAREMNELKRDIIWIKNELRSLAIQLNKLVD